MNIFCDYDSTLNNLCEEWIEWINHEHDLSYKIEDVSTYDWIVNVGEIHNFKSFNFFKLGGRPYDIERKHCCKPIDGAIEFINALKLNGNVSILTATHDDNLREQKDNHISYFFGREIKIIHERKKEKFAMSKGIGNILIDDNPSACLAWAENGGYAILFTNDDKYIYATSSSHKHENLVMVKNYNEVNIAISKYNDKAQDILLSLLSDNYGLCR